MFRHSLFLICILPGLSFGVYGQQAEEVRSDPAAEIRQLIAEYVEAFNSQDVETLQNQWTAEGVYLSRISGERVEGREAISAQFRELLAEEDISPQLSVQTDSIEMISPHVALERGVAVVVRGEEVSDTAYDVVYIKEGERWLIDRVTEYDHPAETRRHEELEQLAWLIGQWVDDGEGITVEIDCNWTANQNFISRAYSVSSEEGFESSGLQIIGWDANRKEIRSWLFDAEGGFISGTWKRRGEQWVVQSVATLADGTKGSFVSTFTPLADGNYRWQKINQVADGEFLPNLDEITVRRK